MLCPLKTTEMSSLERDKIDKSEMGFSMKKEL